MIYPHRRHTRPFAVDLNGRKFASGVSPEPVTVPAYGEALVEVDMVSNLAGVIRQVLELGQESNLRYRLSGKLNVTDFVGKIPFEYEGELTLASKESGSDGLWFRAL